MAVLQPWAKPAWVENDQGVLMPYEQALYVTSEDASITLTYTDLPDDSDPAGVGATQLDLKAAGGGGGGVSPVAFDYYISDWTYLPSDGASRQLATTSFDAPFTNEAGQITQAGIYAIGFDLNGEDAPTFNNLVYAISGQFMAQWLISMDLLFASGGIIRAVQESEIGGVTAAQLPLTIGIGVDCPTDSTGDAEARILIAQIAA